MVYCANLSAGLEAGVVSRRMINEQQSVTLFRGDKNGDIIKGGGGGRILGSLLTLKN